MTFGMDNLKRLVRALIIAACLISLINLPASAATNLLKNPGFEEGELNWDTGLEVFSIKGPAHTGSAAMYVEALTRASVQQCVGVSQSLWDSWTNVQGKKYLNVDGYVKTDQYVELAYVEIWAWSNANHTPDCIGAGSHWTSNVITGNRNWTKISEAPGAVLNPFGLDEKPDAVSVALIVEPVIGANGIAAFDDMSLYNLTPGAVNLNDFKAVNAAQQAGWILAGALLCLALLAAILFRQKTRT